jgi:hypothetical protein
MIPEAVVVLVSRASCGAFLNVPEVLSGGRGRDLRSEEVL